MRHPVEVSTKAAVDAAAELVLRVVGALPR